MPPFIPIICKGGYNLDAISSSALACLNVLLGEQPPKLPSLSASESATQVMYEVALEQSKYWKCINETMREGREGMAASHVHCLLILRL